LRIFARHKPYAQTVVHNMNNMNRTLTYLILTLILVSCSKDDDSLNNKVQLTENNIDIQLTNVNFGIFDIDFINENNGFAIDTQGQILTTNNSGVDWTVLYSSEYELLDIQFISNQIGYVLAKIQNEQTFFLLKTSDYGQSFKVTSIPNGSDLNRIYFTNNNVGFALGNHILRTSDNGLNWDELELDFNVWNDLLEIGNELYACGLNGTLIKSTDLGVNWGQINLGINSHLYEIYPFQDIFYFRGQSIVKSSIGTTQEFEIPATLNDLHVYTNDITIGFGLQYPELGFFPDGAMFISNNSGKSWQTTLYDNFNSITKVDFVNSTIGYGIAYDWFNGKIYLIKIIIEE